MEAFKEREKELNQLDKQAWDDLKNRARHYVCAKDKSRRYQQFICCLNEAKGYLYLKDQNFKEIRFLPTKEAVPTPDLCARGPGGRALLEVKTLNYSKKILESMRDKQCRNIEEDMSDDLVKRLKRIIARARKQLLSYKDWDTSLKIIYLVIRDRDCAVNAVALEQLKHFIEAINSDNPEVKIIHKCMWV